MPVFKSNVLLCTLFSIAIANVFHDGWSLRQGRKFLPEYIIGDYVCLVKQGSCSEYVNVSFSNRVDKGTFVVSHDTISGNSYNCTISDFLSVITQDNIFKSGNGFILERAPLDKVLLALEAHGAAFMIGFEKTNRTCGPIGTLANSNAVFGEEKHTIEIPRLITLYPGAKYMIVYEPTSPIPCTYFCKIDNITNRGTSGNGISETSALIGGG